MRTRPLPDQNTEVSAPVRTPDHLRRFARDEDGTLIVFAVYIFILILMIGGIGIDLMRFERDRSQLQTTLDRAVLAAAATGPKPQRRVVWLSKPPRRSRRRRSSSVGTRTRVWEAIPGSLRIAVRAGKGELS